MKNWLSLYINPRIAAIKSEPLSVETPNHGTLQKCDTSGMKF
jgi:hypothetical protein